MEPFNPQAIQGYRVTAIPVRHPLEAVGFEITSEDGRSLFYTGDTGPCLSHVWERVSPQLLVADVTFPNRLNEMARDAEHLCPEMLKDELIEFLRIKGYLPKVIVIHLSPQFEPEIDKEVKQVAKALGASINIAREGEELIL